MFEAVRLVVWDLDETFWKGTLSEEGITEYDQSNHDAVITLAERGILSSICSKNDIATVKAILEEKGIWEYFVFPSIDWSPKGPRLSALVEAVQLRPESILFIDDNHGNRAEAASCVPGLQIADHTFARHMLTDERFVGKADKPLSRLKQYKLLEQRAADQAASGGNNIDFLRSSNIQITIDHEVVNNLDRAIELINRTNQLNFTKLRLPDDKVEARQLLLGQLNENFDVRAGLVSVTDRFGDYGIVGFYLMKGHRIGSSLVHFCFSCRTLGMGVEQWIYHKLGKPRITVVGKVLSELATETEPDWINVKNTREPVDERKLRPFEVRLRGGCELEVIGHFMRLEAPSVKLEVVTQKGLFPIMRHSSALLHQALKPHNADVEAALAKVGLPSEDFNSSFFSPCENDTAIVFSNTADVHPLYRHKSLDITICVNQPELGMITRSSLEELDNFFNERKVGKDERERVLKIYRELRNNYELIYGSPALDQLALMFRDIISRIPKNGLMLWVAPNSVYVRDGRLIENPTIERNNSSLREAAKKSPNVKIIEMTSLVQTNEEFTSRPDHFNRMVYYRLAQRIYSDFDQWRQADKAA